MSNARFSILQARAIGDTRISNSQFRTLAALGLYGDQEGWCFPKLSTLGKLLAKSKQAVSKDIQMLAELGYVEIKHQYREDGSQMNNLYRLVFDSIPTRQPDVDPNQQGVYPPSTPDVDPPSISEVDALTPHINDPIKQGIKSGAKRPRDERLSHPSIVVYRDVAKLQVPEILRDDVISTVGDDAIRWGNIVKQWIGNGWKPGNINGMLDYYRNGGNGNGRKQAPANEPAGFAGIREYLESQNGNE